MSLLRDDQIRRLFELDADINRIQDLDLLLEAILRAARLTLSADAGSLYLVEEKKLIIRYSQNRTLESRLPPGERLSYAIFSLNIDRKTIAGYCAQTGETVNIANAYAIPADAPFSYNTQYDLLNGYECRSMLTLPMKTNTGQVLGVLQLINAVDSAGKIASFTDDDEQIGAHFGSNATMVLQRAQLTRTMILRMSRMAELRDPKETGPHVNRVAAYATELYRRWAVKQNLGDPAEIVRSADLFRMAAMLHDVGKIGIDDAILKKPGPLTDEEYNIMKTHTEIGASLFADPQSEFDQLAADVSLSHHERWDGTGYPRGLKGKEISLWGRITSIADVYDALSCHRVYKPAWPEERVVAELKSQSGKQFDPDLVRVFLESLPAFRQITARYPDV